MSLPLVRSRIVFLDWLRGLAAIVMIQGHTFDSFLQPQLRDHPVFIFSQFFGGEAAAVFLFLTGITFALGMNRRDDLSWWPRIAGALRRSRYLFLLAFAFRLQLWLFAWPSQPWTDLLHVDVLNLMGATAALLSVTALAHGMQRVRWAIAAGVGIAALAPLATGLNSAAIPHLLRDYLAPRGETFGIFPWGSYLAFGLAAGSAIPLVRRGDWGRVMQWSALCGFALLFAGRYFSNLPFSIYPHANFWLDSPALVACKLGITLLLASAAFLWTEYLSDGWSPVRVLGTTSLAVYWVHVELVYGRWFAAYKQNLTVWQCVEASAALALAMVGMSVALRTARGRWQSSREVSREKRAAA
ncbi:MAG TPA: heparan-alpha-glucosaminide N-acetyltransferase domain-containing protein [Bryobacteraceae bacterium]